MGFFKKIKKSFDRGGKSAKTMFDALAKGDTKTGLSAFHAAVEPIISLGVSSIFADKDGRTHTSKTLTKLNNRAETGQGKFESLSKIQGKKDAFDLNLDVAQIEASAQLASDEEKKRRNRRNNIVTKPLGALVSQGSLTRVLTGQ